MRSAWIVCVAFISMAPACGDDDSPGAADSGPRRDSAIALEGGALDLGSADTGVPSDAGSDDTGPAFEAGTADAGPTDAGLLDAGPDGGDSSRPDGGPADTCGRDEDCPGGICWAAPDGAHHCTMRIDPPLDSCDGSLETCCRSDADCVDGPGGRCAAFTFGYCGGAAPPPGNTCRYDGCATDGDCAGGICLPPGAIGNLNAQCIAAPCRSGADCTMGAAGECVFSLTGGFCPSPAVYCVYDGDPCRTDLDCRTGGRRQICVSRDGHGTECVDEPPPPP